MREEETEDEPTETAPPWPFRAGPLQSSLQDLIVIQSTLNQTTVAQLSVGDAAELIQLHSTEVKDLFVNAYWRAQPRGASPGTVQYCRGTAAGNRRPRRRSQRVDGDS